jgi:hypothetical protein
MQDLTPFMRLGNAILGLAAAAIGVGAAVGAAACGGGDEVPATITTNVGGAPRTAASASTPAGATQASTAQTPSSGSTTPPPATTTTTATTQSTRVPAVFTLKGGSLSPKTVSVPAFLAAEVTVTSADGQVHVITVKVGKGYTLRVSPKGSATVKVPGQKSGRFQVLVDNRPAAAIVWGGEPGP